MTREEFMKTFTFGDKVTCDRWDECDDGAVIETFEREIWCDSNGETWPYDENWQLYKEPKKKVVKWLWAIETSSSGDKGWHTHRIFMTDIEAKAWNTGDNPIQKLEFSRQEFEE
jgi:hypothetical protein